MNSVPSDLLQAIYKHLCWEDAQVVCDFFNEDKYNKYNSCAVQVLQKCLPNKTLFKEVCSRLVKDVQRLKEGDEWGTIIMCCYTNFLIPQSVDDGTIDYSFSYKDFTEQAVKEHSYLPEIFYDYMKGIYNMDLQHREIVVNDLFKFCKSCHGRQFVNMAGNTAVSALRTVLKNYKIVGGAVSFAFAILFLAYDMFTQRKRMIEETISRDRFFKNGVDTIVTFIGGIIGYFGGVAAANYFFPGVSTPITISAGLTGGLAGGYFAFVGSDMVTRKFFELPRDRVLENAYRFLGLPCTAKNQDINTRYRQLCDQYCPDYYQIDDEESQKKKQERQEFWNQLQLHIGVIKKSRKFSVIVL